MQRDTGRGLLLQRQPVGPHQCWADLLAYYCLSTSRCWIVRGDTCREVVQIAMGFRRGPAFATLLYYNQYLQYLRN